MSDDDLSWLQDDLPLAGRRQKGISIAELLDLPETLRELLVEIARREPVGLADLARALGRSLVELEVQLYQLVAHGWLNAEEDDQGLWVYRVQIERGEKRILPPGVWQVIEDQWQIPIFRLFSDAMREELSHAFHLERHKPGTVLFEGGSWGEQMYIVEAGKVEEAACDKDGNPFVVQEIGPGGILGEVAVLLGERRAYTARVAQEAQIWTLTKTDLEHLLAQHPDVGLTLRQMLARKLRSPARAIRPQDRYNPIVAVGEGGSELARHLAEQTLDRVMLIDLTSHPPDPLPNLVYVDGRGLHSQAIVDTIYEKARDAWVVVSVLPHMTDQFMRVINLAEVIIDMTSSGARWLQAASAQYWTAPASGPRHLARLARRLCGRVTGLVLSGGVARTLAHLGVLDVLHQAGVPIDMIASCGYGALWGILYAAEWSPQQMIDLVTSQAARLHPFKGHTALRATSRPGLFDARHVRSWIQGIVGELGFSDLEIPCHVATYNLSTGETTWLQDGPIFSALSACVAVPGLVTPVEYQGRLLVDALLSNPLPVDAMVAGGADVTLVSNAIPASSRGQVGDQDDNRSPDLISSWLGICSSTAHERSQRHLGLADLIINPDVSGFSDAAFDQASTLIERGRLAAHQALPRVQSLLKQKE